MKVSEVREAFNKSESLSQAILGKPCEGITLSLSRKGVPKGDKLRTPFGMCEIFTIKQDSYSGEFTINFFVTRKQVLSFLKKVEKL